MVLIALGNGVLFAYVPLRLAEEGFAPWVAGAVVTAMSAGSLAGCLVVGGMVRRVGHARTFASLAAAVSLSVLIITLGTAPVLWIVSRALYGFALAGLFVVAQSWLNDACENAWRGRVIGLFHMSYVVAIGTGSYCVGFVELMTLTAPLLSLLFAALAILPVSLTRLDAPPPPVEVTVAVRAVWRISPVALAALLAVGGLTMLVQGFAPIYATAEGYAQREVALLMFLMQFGMLGVQLPLGALSDRVDRRYVLVVAAEIVVLSAAIAVHSGRVDLVWLILIFAVWAGATETIFAVANAHANDRADPQYYVALSSTLLVAWSVSGLVLPGLATALTPVLGPQAFMHIAMVVASLFAGFVLYRMTRRGAARGPRHEPCHTLSAQAPLAAEFAPHLEDGR